MHKAELYLVHIITPLPPFSPPPEGRPAFNIPEYIENLRISAEKSLKDVIDKKIGNKLKTKAVILHGDAAGEIARFTEKNNVGGGRLIHPVRLAVSGTGVGPSLFDMLELLGKDTVIKRLKIAIEKIPNNQQ